MTEAWTLRALRYTFGYGLLALAAIWLVRIAIGIGKLQGWYEAQGGTNFYYPTVELIAGAAMLTLGTILARTRAWLFAPALALIVLSFTTVFWIGFTR